MHDFEIFQVLAGKLKVPPCLGITGFAVFFPIKDGPVGGVANTKHRKWLGRFLDVRLEAKGYLE